MINVSKTSRNHNYNVAGNKIKPYASLAYALSGRGSHSSKKGQFYAYSGKPEAKPPDQEIRAILNNFKKLNDEEAKFETNTLAYDVKLCEKLINSGKRAANVFYIFCHE